MADYHTQLHNVRFELAERCADIQALVFLSFIIVGSSYGWFTTENSVEAFLIGVGCMLLWIAGWMMYRLIRGIARAFWQLVTDIVHEPSIILHVLAVSSVLLVLSIVLQFALAA
jgi:uncharacterized membrane protein YidH (DUF202 family)